MEFQCRGTAEGVAEFSPYERARFKAFLRENPGIRLTITPDLPESGRLRRYFEGALVPLICFYSENLDHRNSEDRRKVREWLKLEFNSDLVDVGGTVHKVAKTTKGRPVLNEFVERVVDWLNENYAPPAEAMDPEKYKYWRDVLYAKPGTPDTYIDYLVETGVLRKITNHS